MSLRRAAFLAIALLAAPVVAAPLSVAPVIVKSGYFLADDCRPTADPKLYNECICQADIKKAQISGVAGEVASAINAELAMLPEKLAAESCEGKPTTPPTEGLKVNTTNANFVVPYQSDTTLTVLITYSTYGAGAEHPLEGTEGFTFDIASGQLVDPIMHLKPDQLAKANQFIKSELLKKYPTALFEEVKARVEPYLTENGCDTCTLFYGKEGWMVRFQLDAIAPYMTGEPEIAIPADIIAPPEKLIVKN